MSFAEMVDDDKVLFYLGFNYHEPSFPVPREKGFGHIYHSTTPQREEVNFVVADIKKKEGWEYYFKTFIGNGDAFRMSKPEYEDFLRKVFSVLDEENKVPGCDLERKMKEAAMALAGVKFPE